RVGLARPDALRDQLPVRVGNLERLPVFTQAVLQDIHDRTKVGWVECADFAKQRWHVHWIDSSHVVAPTGSASFGAHGAGVVRALNRAGSWNGLNSPGSQ